MGNGKGDAAAAGHLSRAFQDGVLARKTGRLGAPPGGRLCKASHPVKRQDARALGQAAGLGQIRKRECPNLMSHGGKLWQHSMGFKMRADGDWQGGRQRQLPIKREEGA